MGIAIMFLWLFAVDFHVFACRNLSSPQCELVPLAFAAPVVLTAIALFTTILMFRWAERISLSAIGPVIAAWVMTVGFVAARVEPFRVSRDEIIGAAVWGTFGIALLRLGIRSVLPKHLWVANVIATALFVAFCAALVVASAAFPEFTGFFGGGGGD